MVVCDHAFGMAVPATAGDVDVLVVEEHPHLGLLRGGRPLLRLLLDEVRRAGHQLIQLFIQPSVDDQRHLGADGPHHDVPFCVADEHSRRDRNRTGNVAGTLRVGGRRPSS